MTTGLVLIVAILVLGGVIATVGDRLGMRVGKARLTLFRLRPRQTATVITILTGSIISASTFAILFAVSDQLRTGVFELSEIQDDLRDARRDLQDTTTENRQIERQLNQSRRQQQAADRQLSRAQRALRNTRERQAETEDQLDRSQTRLSQTQTRLSQIQTNFEQAQDRLRSVSGQADELRGEIEQLQSERQILLAQQQAVREQIDQRDAEIADRERAIAERDRALADRNQEIASRESALQDLESQRSILEQEVQRFERELQGLRQGNVALSRNQPLAAGIVRIVNPNAAPQAIDRLILEANETARQRILPGSEDSNQQVIQITNAEVEQLRSQIQDGRDYVVRILAASNYFVGEPCVLAGEACVNVYGSVVLNQRVFVQGQVIATTTVDPTTMSNARLIERIQLLVAQARFRAQQAGISIESIQVADNRSETIVNFFNQIKQYNQPLDLQAVAASATNTGDPLTIELYASQNNQVLFGTQ
ncbi:DUF3084 domain-containing protein [Microcoleus sp. FACHB-1515]|uniref:DUF3084 domain-containing protein n=1 Tax=Cyanophyceae TaxID=3028117 RepID=UPI001683B171|nr:DUF3084 domain-containing protein [Microcoleus sp. FACHB-1515]MBD2092683.1 DUF3084 domain-containing protein [Microcoleus sp. FACHB-1515]